MNITIEREKQVTTGRTESDKHGVGHIGENLFNRDSLSNVVSL